MNEQFDKELRNHIRDTFDHFDDQMMEDGWKKFKRQKNRKRRFIIWYSLPTGIAAGLALLWYINVFDSDFQTPKSQNNPNLELTKKPAEQSKSSIQENVDSEKITVTHNENATLNNSELSTSPNSNDVVLNSNQVKLATNTNRKVIKPKQGIKVTEHIQLAKSDLIVSEIREEEILVSRKENFIAITSTPISNLDFSDKLIAQNTSDLSSIKLQEQSIDFKEKPVSINDNDKFLAIASLTKNEKDNKSIDLKKDKKFKMSIDANTYLNFSEMGLNEQINLGLGFASELKLAKNLSLNSGILLNRQTGTFEGNGKSSYDFKRNSLSTFAAVPKAQVTQAKLVGLDIPLNLKFDVKMGKAKTYITSGISSYSVINEKYINDYSVVNYSFTGAFTNNVRTVQDNPAGSFSYFKFARTINLSFGVIYPVSKKANLSVEPFMKYPLTGLGYQDLKIGSGGLSFKLNFGK